MFLFSSPLQACIYFSICTECHTDFYLVFSDGKIILETNYSIKTSKSSLRDKRQSRMAACFPTNSNSKIIRWATCLSLSAVVTITSCTYPHYVCRPCHSWWLQWFIYHLMNKSLLLFTIKILVQVERAFSRTLISTNSVSK